jgi:hypothetical protein
MPNDTVIKGGYLEFPQNGPSSYTPFVINSSLSNFILQKIGLYLVYFQARTWTIDFRNKWSYTT